MWDDDDFRDDPLPTRCGCKGTGMFCLCPPPDDAPSEPDDDDDDDC